MPRLSEPDIVGRMSAAKGWERLGDMLVRSWQFTSTRRTLESISQVVALADRLDHHSGIILSDRSVRLKISTHADGGLTDEDFALAAEVDALPTDR